MCFWINAYQPYPFLFMEASVKGDSEHVSHTLCHYFCKHKLPCRNCVSDLPFTVGGELVSQCLLLPITLPPPFFVVVVMLFLLLRKKN